MSDAVAITELVIALHHGRVRLRPITTTAGRLFQARMWRGYAMAWDGRPTPWGERYSRGWMEEIFRIPRAECLRRARVNLYLARRLNR
jgi:hypothetical protein